MNCAEFITYFNEKFYTNPDRTLEHKIRVRESDTNLFDSNYHTLMFQHLGTKEFIHSPYPAYLDVDMETIEKSINDVIDHYYNRSKYSSEILNKV